MQVTIEIHPIWVKVVRSPIYFAVSASTVISLTIVPLSLYWTLKGKFPAGSEAIVVPLCFAVILCVLAFYCVLGSAVARELRRKL